MNASNQPYLPNPPKRTGHWNDVFMPGSNPLPHQRARSRRRVVWKVLGFLVLILLTVGLASLLFPEWF